MIGVRFISIEVASLNREVQSVRNIETRTSNSNFNFYVLCGLQEATIAYANHIRARAVADNR